MAQNNAQNNNPNGGDVGQLPFERAIEELEFIVRRLEEGKVPLEELIAIYERGEALKRCCEGAVAAGRGALERLRSTPPAGPAARSRWTSILKRCAAAPHHASARNCGLITPGLVPDKPGP